MVTTRYCFFYMIDMVYNICLQSGNFFHGHGKWPLKWCEFFPRKYCNTLGPLSAQGTLGALWKTFLKSQRTHADGSISRKREQVFWQEPYKMRYPQSAESSICFFLHVNIPPLGLNYNELQIVGNAWVFGSYHGSSQVRFVLCLPNLSWQKSQNRSGCHFPSGKRLHNYGKLPCFIAKATISMAMFNSYVSHYQRVHIEFDFFHIAIEKMALW